MASQPHRLVSLTKGAPVAATSAHRSITPKRMKPLRRILAATFILITSLGITGIGASPEIRQRNGRLPHRVRHTIGRRKRRLITGLAALLMVLAGLVATPAPASAVTCWGDWCSGRSPYSTGCHVGAYPGVHARIRGTWTYIKLWYSPTCKTSWAEVPSYWSYGSNAQKLSVVQQWTGYTQAGVIDRYNGRAATGMIYSSRRPHQARWTGSPGSTATSYW